MEGKQLARKLHTEEKGRRPFSTRFSEYYTSPDATDPKMLGKTTPTAVHNLEVFRRFRTIQKFKELFARKKKELQKSKKEFRVLFDGFSTPFNVVAMHDFLVKHLGVPPEMIRIVAIDLSEEPMAKGAELAKEHGINFRFEVTDARKLPFESGEFNIVFQDFLLNCAPHDMHEAILSETQRVLSPSGLALVGWTSAEGLIKRVPEFGKFNFEIPSPLGQFQWDFHNKRFSSMCAAMGNAFSISDVENNPELQRLLRFALKKTGGFMIDFSFFESFERIILVTPNDDFEFFKSRVKMLNMLQCAGMAIAEMHLDVGTDRFKHTCWRHRFVLTTSPELFAIENVELLDKLGDEDAE